METHQTALPSKSHPIHLSKSLVSSMVHQINANHITETNAIDSIWKLAYSYECLWTTPSIESMQFKCKETLYMILRLLKKIVEIDEDERGKQQTCKLAFSS
ncbi:CLUMA_CG000563, isoform A [Clunio marinus]|uniref:CLUMA_CG000563, isoform A n=1 Tax=Clunio marinus TaxID=568069 RepID=A0A1J1HGQ0_9DIPT|nr:CLUMA_CG000563, isoform A [Clunio marinus]